MYLRIKRENICRCVTQSRTVIIIDIFNIIIWNESLIFSMPLINSFIYWLGIFWTHYMLDIVTIPVSAIKKSDSLADRESWICKQITEWSKYFNRDKYTGLLEVWGMIEALCQGH